MAAVVNMFSSKFSRILQQNTRILRIIAASWTPKALNSSHSTRPSSSLITPVVNCPLICTGSTRCYSSSSVSQSSSTSGPISSDTQAEFSMENLESVLKEQSSLDKDMPVCDMKNPFEKPHKKCILCQYNIDPNYKNVKLLSQFVSPYTGRIFGRHVTGLCIPMQRRVSLMIKRARRFGFMPLMFKQSEYLKDPALFDPFKRVKNPEL